MTPDWGFHDTERAEMQAYKLQFKKPDEALALYRKVLDSYERLGRQKKKAICHNKIGNILLDQGKLKEALAHFLEGLAIEEKHSDDYDTGVAMVNIADVLERTGRNDDAIKYYRSAEALAKKMPETGGKLMLMTAVREGLKRLS